MLSKPDQGLAQCQKWSLGAIYFEGICSSMTVYSWYPNNWRLRFNHNINGNKIIFVRTLLISFRLERNINIVRAVISFKLHIWNCKTCYWNITVSCFVCLISIFMPVIDTMNTLTYLVWTQTPYGFLLWEIKWLSIATYILG